MTVAAIGGLFGTLRSGCSGHGYGVLVFVAIVVWCGVTGVCGQRAKGRLKVEDGGWSREAGQLASTWGAEEGDVCRLGQ